VNFGCLRQLQLYQNIAYVLFNAPARPRTNRITPNARIRHITPLTLGE